MARMLTSMPWMNSSRAIYPARVESLQWESAALTTIDYTFRPLIFNKSISVRRLITYLNELIELAVTQDVSSPSPRNTTYPCSFTRDLRMKISFVSFEKKASAPAAVLQSGLLAVWFTVSRALLKSALTTSVELFSLARLRRMLILTQMEMGFCVG